VTQWWRADPRAHDLPTMPLIPMVPRCGIEPPTPRFSVLSMSVRKCSRSVISRTVSRVYRYHGWISFRALVPASEAAAPRAAIAFLGQRRRCALRRRARAMPTLCRTRRPSLNIGLQQHTHCRWSTNGLRFPWKLSTTLLRRSRRRSPDPGRRGAKGAASTRR